MCNQRKRSSSNPNELNPGVHVDLQGVSCDGERWWGSNFGTNLDIVAPGVKIYSTDIQGTAGYNKDSGTNGNYYDSFNGTSAATPYAAGIMALILSVNPSLTQSQARQILESNTNKISGYSYSTVSGQPNGTWNNEVGYGLVDAFASVQAAIPCSGTTTISNVTYTTNTTISDCHIIVTNTSIANNSTVVFDGGYRVTINGPFEVQSGSSLTVN